jgi:dTDP-4-dehydrorhamnose reductase
MQILILGASGQVGKRLMKACAQRGLSASGTARHPTAPLLQADITDPMSLRNVMSTVKPSVVFLCSALTAVDYCEEHPDEAQRLNVDGVRHVADLCLEFGARLVFLSSEYVFDGAAGPYSETDPVSPQSVYGRTKVDGEKIALRVPGSIVARTAGVYDWDPDSKNFVMQMIQRLSQRQPTRVVDDQASRPTLARNLAEVLLDLVAANAMGIFNVVGPDFLSRFDFTLAIARAFNFDTGLVTPVKTSEFNQKAPRPAKADLLIDKVRRTVATRLIGVADGLQLVKHDAAGVAA